MEYFAGANTKNGFVSLFEEVFSGTERIFILKGSSGCGKSTLMRRVASHAQEHGLDTDVIRCSSDPDSLDGVIIPSLGVAVADGTAPHVLDVKYPCVRESIINLGEFWDESHILPHRDRIISLTDEKGVHYKNAYRALSAAGKVSELKRQLVSEHIDRSRLDALTFRILNDIDTKQGDQRRVFATSFSSDGVSVLPAFGEVNTLIRLNGACAYELMKTIHGILLEQGTEAVVSCTFMDAVTPDAVFLPASQTLITSLKNPPCVSAKIEKRVSSARFTSTLGLSECKNRIKSLDALQASLLDEARQELHLAKNAHNSLESIYIPAMDFVRLDKYTASLIQRIFDDGNKH